MSRSSGPPIARDDWSFELSGLRGRGFIVAGTLGDWQMKRVRRDGLEIELTQRVTTVSGDVSDDGGGVALDSTVIAFSDDEGKWGPRSRFIASARPDQQGRFTIKGLPPGRYVAIAVGYLEPGEERDPGLLEAWHQAGTRFTLSEGDPPTQSDALQVLDALSAVRVSPVAVVSIQETMSATWAAYVSKIDVAGKKLEN